jgi:MazG family protein
MRIERKANMRDTDKKINELLSIMEELRRSCPWDRAQTPQTLRRYILEETYEVIETIDEEQWDKLPEELGDLLLQIVFQCAIAEEQNRFRFSDVLQRIIDKLIDRHPHVFSDTEVISANEVADNWEHIKVTQENRTSMLSGIPEQAPALLRAQRLQEKAARVGFDWLGIDGVIAKVEEELAELMEAIKRNEKKAIVDEIGDFLFSTVNLCRFLNIVAEDALRLSNKKFISRFRAIESHFGGNYQKMKNAGLEALDKVWEKTKHKHKNGQNP